MRKLIATTLLGLSLLTPTPPTWSCAVIPHQIDTAPKIDLQVPGQKALIYRQGNVEHLIVSIQFSGPTDQFAWLIPVESKPQVDVLPGAAFHELERLTTLVPPQRASAMSAPAMAGAPAAPPVRVLERKESGPFDLAILKATDTGGLFDWLRDNGFPLDPNRRSGLDYYVQHHWVFIAARIRPASAGNSTVANRMQQGTIAPLHIRYPARELSYPMRITSDNPGSSHMDLYVAEDHINMTPGFTDDRFALHTTGGSSYTISGPPGALSQTDAPTLSKLLPGPDPVIHHLSAELDQAERNKDLVFATLHNVSQDH